MQTHKKTQTQYITNSLGTKTSVVIPIKEYEDLLEDLKDLAAIAEHRKEPTISHDKLITQLKNDDLL